jgi:RNA polymerase sigma-70 factor (ECF subfamily)
VTIATTEEDFAALVEPLRRELLAHCYRMTGSLHDAEDLVQETYLRAWRGQDALEHRAAVRAWMYRIATNACLTHLGGRRRRPLPTGLGAPASDPAVEPRPHVAESWLEPLPDAVVWGTAPDDPAAAVVTRESVRLAFVAALQHLTARQRAVLLLRDVLAMSAAETADALGMTVAGVNSTLQRAKAQVARLDPGDPEPPADDRRRRLLASYLRAFEDYDVAGIVALMSEDVVWEMPPYPGWYRGASAVGDLIGRWCPATGPGDMRMVPVRVNGEAGFALYMRDDEGRHRAFQLQVLVLGPGGVEHVVVWFGSEPFVACGLPETLPEAGRGAGSAPVVTGRSGRTAPS